MRICLLTFFITCFVLPLSGFAKVEEQELKNWPSRWVQMEVESKWSTDRKGFTRMTKELLYGALESDLLKQFQLKIVPKYGGVPTRMVDEYFDSPKETIVSSGHALRHRVMWYVPNINDLYADPEDFDLESILRYPGEMWVKHVERVQYKSDARVLHATWFRLEVGTDSADERNYTVQEILSGEATTHPTVLQLKKDHPNISFSSLRRVLKVTDYRSRYEIFLSDRDGSVGDGAEPLFEISMDMQERIVDLKNNKELPKAYEVEIEILAGENTKNMTVPNMKLLFKVSNYLEKKFQLTPSVTSKGGVRVDSGSDEL